jgi:hypothetical protein
VIKDIIRIFQNQEDIRTNKVFPSPKPKAPVEQRERRKSFILDAFAATARLFGGVNPLSVQDSNKN